jgi:hypothetical protein
MKLGPLHDYPVWRAYRDVTSYYQGVPSYSGDLYLYNTRNDDVAYIRINHRATGQFVKTVCIRPNSPEFVPPHEKVTGIKIRPESTCSE